MKLRVGAVRAVCLGLVGAGLVAGSATLSSPAARAALPAPDSASWIAVTKAGTTLTDGAGDFAPPHLDLTATGGAAGPATVFVAADLKHASFRFHVAALPADAAGGYVVQFDTDSNTAGWERALRYDPSTDTISFFTGGPNAAVTDAGTPAGAPVATTATTAASYPGAAGGAHVAFAVPRTRLASAGIILGAPMVIGTTVDGGAALTAGGGLLAPVNADALGTGAYGFFGVPAWSTLATDPIDFDSDGDGFVDRLDNCPVDVNPGQEDDDAAVDNSIYGVSDGTEGLGNACDSTPRGYDLEPDGVGSMDDSCPARVGRLTEDGCILHVTTRATLDYRPADGAFTGRLRADHEVCLPRRRVTVFKVVGGPDRSLGTVLSGRTGRFRLAESARSGRYYALVDTKLVGRVGARCFRVKSPVTEVG